MTNTISKIKDNYKHLEKNKRDKKNLYDKKYFDISCVRNFLYF